MNRLYEEVAYVAYHFHWPHAQLMELDHRERRQWVHQIAALNRRINQSDSETVSLED